MECIECNKDGPGHRAVFVYNDRKVCCYCHESLVNGKCTCFDVPVETCPYHNPPEDEAGMRLPPHTIPEKPPREELLATDQMTESELRKTLLQPTFEATPLLTRLVVMTLCERIQRLQNQVEWLKGQVELRCKKRI